MTELIKYDAACKAIAEAKRIDEVKLIRDKAEALRAAAKIAKNRQAEIDLAEIRFRAEIRLGELLREIPREKRGGDRKSNHPKDPLIPTLKQLDIKQGSRTYTIAMNLNKIPKDKKEKAIKEWRQQADLSNQRLIGNFYNSLGIPLNKPKRLTIDESKLRPGKPGGVKCPILVTPEESAALSAAITKESVRLNMLTNRLNDTLSLLREHLNSLDDEDFTALENALDAAVKAFAEGKKNLRRKNVRVITGGKND